jgi:hypothetical protein
MNRRRFFGNLGLLIAACAAPTILVPKSPINWGKPLLYVPVRRKLKATWSVELEQDLQAYHGINASEELTAILLHQAQLEFPNSEIMSIHKSDEWSGEPTSFLAPRRIVYAEMREIV